MSNPANILTTHALETLPSASLPRQAALYRAIASLAAGRTERKRFEDLAVDCDKEIAQQAVREAKHQQLVLDFKRGAL